MIQKEKDRDKLGNAVFLGGMAFFFWAWFLVVLCFWKEHVLRGNVRAKSKAEGVWCRGCEELSRGLFSVRSLEDRNLIRVCERFFTRPKREKRCA